MMSVSRLPLRFGAIQVVDERRIEPKKEPVRYEMSLNFTEAHRDEFAPILEGDGTLKLVAVNDRFGFSLKMPEGFDWKNALQVDKLADLVEKLLQDVPNGDLDFSLKPEFQRKFGLWAPIYQNAYENSLSDHRGAAGNEQLLTLFAKILKGKTPKPAADADTDE